MPTTTLKLQVTVPTPLPEGVGPILVPPALIVNPGESKVSLLRFRQADGSITDPPVGTTINPFWGLNQAPTGVEMRELPNESGVQITVASFAPPQNIEADVIVTTP